MNYTEFNEEIKKEASETGMYPARISSAYKNIYKVLCRKGEMNAEISGKIRYLTDDRSGFPVVGDFVLIDREENENGNAIIHLVFPRKSWFARKNSGKSSEMQMIASNIDKAFICMSLNEDYNLRRLERYLSIAWDSGAVPVIILTKSDLCDDTEMKIAEVSETAIGVDIVVTSFFDDNQNEIMKQIGKNETVVFLGSSGVGKSTIINKLAGENILETGEIRKDGKGKHTTTFRQLIILPNGGMVIDTPGMRELGLIQAHTGKTFSDIETFAQECRFRNCTHTVEPGCKVQEALKNGEISPERLKNYLKLKKETKYNGLNSKQTEKEKISNMYKDFEGIKNAKKYVREKNKRKSGE